MKRTITMADVDFQFFQRDKTGKYVLSPIQTVEMVKMSPKVIEQKLNEKYEKVLILGIIEKKVLFEMSLETFIANATVVESNIIKKGD